MWVSTIKPYPVYSELSILYLADNKHWSVATHNKETIKKHISKCITEDVASMMNHQHSVFLSGHSASTTKKAEYIKIIILMVLPNISDDPFYMDS